MCVGVWECDCVYGVCDMWVCGVCVCVNVWVCGGLCVWVCLCVCVGCVCVCVDIRRDRTQH